MKNKSYKYLFLVFVLSFFIEIKLPAQFNPNANYVSQELTVNGYSNFFLGNDFAEPYIATNPRDPLNSICAFINGGYVTTDGLNWIRLGNLSYSDPFLAYDSLGNAYYASLNGNYNLRKSTDKGITWPYNYNMGAQVDKECICAVQSGGPYSNFLYSGWQWYFALPDDDLYFARSTNFGLNWSNLQFGRIGYCPYIAIGHSNTTPGGIIYYGFNHEDSTGNFNVKIKTSTDAGLTFSTAKTISTFIHPPLLKNDSVGANACIQMSADNSYGPFSGNVYVVYTGKGIGSDKADIFFLKSTNYGNNWSDAIKLNDDNTTTDQWMPAISVDKNGKIYIVWYDSRIDPLNNSMTLLYGTISTNGGQSFVPDFPVSTTPFNPARMVANFGGNGYMGHYISVSGVNNCAIAAWTDGRNNDMGSFVSYIPDFAMTVAQDVFYTGSNDSISTLIKVPFVKGPFSDHIKFTASVDSLPIQGNIFLNFPGKDSITTIPDSLYLRILISNVNIPGRYKVSVIGRSTTTGAPVHKRNIDLMVNSSFLNIVTNRDGKAEFKVNGITFNKQQSLPFPNGTNVSVQAISPYIVNSNKIYTFVNWSDNGDTSHSIIINSLTNLTAYYKTQFLLSIWSAAGNTYGGDIFYDSSSYASFGVLSKNVTYNGQVYQFRGWEGLGAGSYTSPDSSGNDTAITLAMHSQILEIARWKQIVGINNIISEIPKENKLFQNYPNPFNPATNIRYQIPKNGFVTLKVYDVIGREVATLVNEKLNAGIYETQFSINSISANGLSSGIYFYKFTAGDFTDIKRMVLIK